MIEFFFFFYKLTDLDERKAEEIGNVPMVFLQKVQDVVNKSNHMICIHVLHKPNKKIIIDKCFVHSNFNNVN